MGIDQTYVENEFGIDIIREYVEENPQRWQNAGRPSTTWLLTVIVEIEVRRNTS